MEQPNNDKFLIVKRIKSFILELEQIINTIPKRDIITRNMIYNDALELLELVTKANYEARKEHKKDYQIQAIAKINKIDFYLERAYKLGYISEKQLLKKSSELKTVNKMIYKWWLNEK